jgi:hypothetical protein
MIARIIALLVFLIIMFPFSGYAAYKIYMKNGSVMSGVGSYEKEGSEITIHFGGGSIGVSEKDVLRIEETGTGEKDFRVGDTQQKQDMITPAYTAPASNNADRTDRMKAELDAINAELKSKDEEEARLLSSLNEKRNRRTKYNIYQLRQLEKEIEPLQQELFAVQQKKTELLQLKAHKEGQLQGQ